MMRDIQADWKHWSRAERIIASLMLACGVSLALASMVYFQA
jgi:hypothetical protein